MRNLDFSFKNLDNQRKATSLPGSSILVNGAKLRNISSPLMNRSNTHGSLLFHILQWCAEISIHLTGTPVTTTDSPDNKPLIHGARAASQSRPCDPIQSHTFHSAHCAITRSRFPLVSAPVLISKCTLGNDPQSQHCPLLMVIATLEIAVAEGSTQEMAHLVCHWEPPQRRNRQHQGAMWLRTGTGTRLTRSSVRLR